MRPTLNTERLRLRPLAEDDLPDLVVLNGDPEVMAFIGPPMSPEAVGAELSGWVQDTGPFGLWSGHDQDGFVGVWFLSSDPGDQAAGEVGWRLARTSWGRGYAVEGARAMVDHSFATLGLTRLWAETMAVNVRSRRVMERLGMTHVRTYIGQWDDPIPGWEQGEVVYELTRAAARSSG